MLNAVKENRYEIIQALDKTDLNLEPFYHHIEDKWLAQVLEAIAGNDEPSPEQKEIQQSLTNMVKQEEYRITVEIKKLLRDLPFPVMNFLYENNISEVNAFLALQAVGDLGERSLRYKSKEEKYQNEVKQLLISNFGQEELFVLRNRLGLHKTETEITPRGLIAQLAQQQRIHELVVIGITMYPEVPWHDLLAGFLRVSFPREILIQEIMYTCEKSYSSAEKLLNWFISVSFYKPYILFPRFEVKVTSDTMNFLQLFDPLIESRHLWPKIIRKDIKVDPELIRLFVFTII